MKQVSVYIKIFWNSGICVRQTQKQLAHGLSCMQITEREGETDTDRHREAYRERETKTVK